jgi:hypothetical protein
MALGLIVHDVFTADYFSHGSTKRKLQKQGRHSASIGMSILSTILMQQ